jgi:hypothetical protein
MRKRGSLLIVSAGLAALLLAGASKAQPVEEIDQVKNWPVTVTTWPPDAEPGLESIQESLPTEPLPFIGIAPCRLVDTRIATLPADCGPPRLSAGAARSFVLTGQAHCSVPSAAQAISINVTAVSPAGNGNIRVYPADATVPNVSTVNFRQGQNTANAAIVALAANGAVTALASVDTDLIIDVNGYFGGTLQTLTWRGVWSNSAVYGAGDLVSHQGSSWVSRIAGNQGTPPATGVPAWDLVAQKGASGSQGSQGIPGPQGPAGSSPWQVNSPVVYYNGGSVGIGTSANPNSPNDRKVKLNIENGNIQLDAEFGLVTPEGAKVITGPGGGTFRFIAASPINDIAYFMDSSQDKKVSIDKSGGIHFKFQKVCSILVGGAWRDNLLVPANWTAATCDRLRSKLGASAYQLACIFDNDFSISSSGSSRPPEPNCGW